MILVDANIWIYALDRALQPEHEAARGWLSSWLEQADLLVPAIIETEVIHYLARQLEPDQARSAITSFLSHPGEFSPLAPWVNRKAAELLVENPDRGIGGWDAALLVHAEQVDATVITHDRQLFATARDCGLDAHDPIAGT